MSRVRFIFGAARVQPGRGFGDETAVREAFAVLESHGIDAIDTARTYGQSETLLGKCNATARFLVDSKVPGGFDPGSLGMQRIKDSIETSLRELQADKINVLYFHAPDISVSIEESLACVDELHKAGFFNRFGLSNFMPDDVEKIYWHCKNHQYVLPEVYQGNYNPVARRQEDRLIPTLRRLGISFYAYSPIAGGLLVKRRSQILAGAGRFVPGSSFWKLYVNETYLDALASWQDIASNADCDPGELAYRWVAFNSSLKGECGDGIVLGSNGTAQLEQTLGWLQKGPLDGNTCNAIDRLWEAVRDYSPLDVFHG